MCGVSGAIKPIALGQFQGSCLILNILFGTCKVMVTTLFSFLVLVQSNDLSNHVFYNFIISLIHYTLEVKYIVKFGS